MKILLVDNGSTLIDKLKNIIPGSETITKWNNFYVEEANNYDLVIFSGSSLFCLEENSNNFSKEISFIKDSKIPIIGICFGSELIIKAFGGTLRRLNEKEAGIVDIKVTKANLIFGNKKSFQVYANHKWTPNFIPSDVIVLAESKNGPEVIKHKKLPIWGFQFHPENMTEKTYGDEILLNLLNSFQ